MRSETIAILRRDSTGVRLLELGLEAFQFNLFDDRRHVRLFRREIDLLNRGLNDRIDLI
jgi:hypothetical protein